VLTYLKLLDMNFLFTVIRQVNTVVLYVHELKSMVAKIILLYLCVFLTFSNSGILKQVI